MSSGGGQQQQTSSTKVVYSPAEQAARDQIAVDAKQIFQNSIQSNNGQYTGAKPVGPSADTQNSWAWGGKAMSDINAGTSRAQTANNLGMSGDLMRADSNPYLQNAMMAATRPMENQFKNAGGPLSTIRNNAVNNGTFGGSRQGVAEGLAAQGLQDKVGDMRAQMSSDAYYKGMDQMNNSIKNQSMLAMMYQMPAQIAGGIGAQKEGYQQNQENYNAAARDYQANYQWEPLKNFANVIYGGSNGTTQTTQSAPKQDNTAAYLGTAASLGMMAMMM